MRLCVYPYLQGIVPVAIGYDGGGSIRTPAALSGVVGYATGFARLPFSSHMQSTNVKAGPFANTVADAALAYAVMARPAPKGYHAYFDEMYDGGFLGVPEAVLTEFLLPAPKGPNKEDTRFGLWALVVVCVCVGVRIGIGIDIGIGIGIGIGTDILVVTSAFVFCSSLGVLQKLLLVLWTFVLTFFRLLCPTGTSPAFVWVLRLTLALARV